MSASIEEFSRELVAPHIVLITKINSTNIRRGTI